MDTTTDRPQTTLVDELRAAALEFHRPPVPLVFEEREAFIATGRYPYNAEVEAAIIAKHQVPEELHRQLAREVYLASGLHHVREMEAQEQAGLADGWRPITDLEPVDGLRVELRDKSTLNPFRVRPDGRSGWILLPRGRRTNGLSLDRLVGCHRAFEGAKQRQQTKMDGPDVVMFRDVR